MELQITNRRISTYKKQIFDKEDTDGLANSYAICYAYKKPPSKRAYFRSRELESYCADVSIPIISVHGLRHTHASLLLYAGVSIASVARRLGHANITTTQHTYLHIIQELENKDNNKIINYLSG